MILKAIIDDREYSLAVPEAVIAEGEDFFAKLDADMDNGCQMSREWVDNPNRLERCQIVADKLLTALEKENDKLGMLMAGYILSRMPEIEAVEIDITGEIQNTHFITRAEPTAAPAGDAPGADAAEAARSGPSPSGSPAAAPSVSEMPAKMSKLAAMEQAGSDVTKVFKVGKAYRFSVFDHASGSWIDSPSIASEQEAERLRQQAFKERFEALQRGE